jgi:hypothetical protein
MGSPYGLQRSAASYYQYGAEPQHYVADWDGMPVASRRAASTRSLGALGPFGLSQNEQRLALVAGLGLVGYLAFKHFSKGRGRRG